VLAVVRCNWVHDRQDGLNILCNNEWVFVTTLSNGVALLKAEHVIEKYNDLLVLHVFVGSFSLCES